MVVPKSVDSSGPEVAELVERTGVVKPMPFQRLVWDKALGERICADGKRRWAAFEVGVMAVRQVGKGTILEGRALAGMHLFGEQKIVWSAHRLKTVNEAMQRMELYYKNCDELRKQVKRILVSHVDMAIELYGDGNSRLTKPRRIEFHTRTKHAARGLTGDCVFLDEAYACSRVQNGALIPIMSTLDDPQLWYTSTPPLDDVASEYLDDPERALGVVLFDLRKRAESDGEDLAWFDWGPAMGLDDVEATDKARRKKGMPPIRDDVDLWYACIPAVGHIIREEQVRRQARAMSPRQFARELLGAWPSLPAAEDDRRPIPDDQWAACADLDAAGDASMAPHDVVFAADAAPHRTYGSIAVYGRRPDGVDQCEIVDHRPGTQWIPARLRELADAHHPLAVVVSARGPLASAIRELRDLGFTEITDRAPRDRRPEKGDLVVTQLVDDAAATAEFIDAVRWTAAVRGVDVAEVSRQDIDGSDRVPLVHLDDAMLSKAVGGAALRDIGDGLQAWGRRSSAAEISTLYAVTLARREWYRRQRIDEVESEPSFESVLANIR